ncbi:beta-lactamase family protein [Streptomyces sp. NBC_00076]
MFARVVAEQGGGVAALAICLDGHPVVDLSYGGPRGARYLLFSVSKGVSAIAAQHAHADGRLDLDAPICDVWPAMRRTATRRITTRHVLSHQAGLPLVDQELTVEDHVAGRLEAALERQEPYWEPGTKHGYHAITYGALLEGVFQRALGTSVAEYIHAHVRRPLGLDLTLGVPPSDNHDVLPLRTRSPMRTPLQSARPGLLFDAVGLGLLDDPSVFNQPDVLAAPWPATTWSPVPETWHGCMPRPSDRLTVCACWTPRAAPPSPAPARSGSTRSSASHPTSGPESKGLLLGFPC